MATDHSERAMQGPTGPFDKKLDTIFRFVGAGASTIEAAIGKSTSMCLNKTLLTEHNGGKIKPYYHSLPMAER